MFSSATVPWPTESVTSIWFEPELASETARLLKWTAVSSTVVVVKPPTS